MPAPLLLDLSHTCHTRARTGIQRVARALHAALGGDALAITHDPHCRAWRELEAWEFANLAASDASGKRGAQWPLAAKLRGRYAQWRGHAGPALPANSGLLVPEVFSPVVAAALPSLFGAVRGARVAVFHDAIALQFPEISPAKTVARFPGYLRELLAFDGIAANSVTSRDALRDYWQWAGFKNPPPVEAILLGVDLPARADGSAQFSAVSNQLPTVLCVGTLEGRKNHVALLDACEALWTRGEKFELRLIGSVNRETGGGALARVRALQGAGRALRYDGALGEAAVAAAYAACAFTIYPSTVEGFGLPVIESLSHGKPCICSARGALGESARGGGCVALDAVGAASLAAAIAGLLAAPEKISALAAEARARKFRTWSDYAAELTAWSRGLKRRN